MSNNSTQKKSEKKSETSLVERQDLSGIEDYSEKKAAMVKQNRVMKKPLPRLNNKLLKSTRRKKYTPARMKNGINKYFEWCEQHDEVPSIKNLMISLDMYRGMFYTYMNYPEFSDMMEQTRLIIAAWLEADVYSTPGQAAAKIAYMKNVHGWTEKSQVQQETKITKVLTVDEARSRIEMLAPKLLEVVKSGMVVNQIGGKDVEEAEVVDKA